MGSVQCDSLLSIVVESRIYFCVCFYYIFGFGSHRKMKGKDHDNDSNRECKEK